MAQYNQAATGKQRKGDTNRTSSQGRKLSSGGSLTKKGDPEMDESAKTPKKEIKAKKEPRLRRS